MNRYLPLAFGVLLALVIAASHPALAGAFSALVLVILVGLLFAPLLYVLAPVFTVSAIAAVTLFVVVPAIPALTAYIVPALAITGPLWLGAVIVGGTWGKRP